MRARVDACSSYQDVKVQRMSDPLQTLRAEFARLRARRDLTTTERYFEIPLDIYSSHIAVCYCPRKRALDLAHEHGAISDSRRENLGFPDSGTAAGMVRLFAPGSGGLDFLIWIQPTGNLHSSWFVSTVAHEACHVAISVFEEIGAEIRWRSSEPFAYLVDHLVKRILDGLY